MKAKLPEDLGGWGIKTEQVIALSKIKQGKVGIFFFLNLLRMLNLIQIRSEKKRKDTVFLNVFRQILKTDCTEHYHAHNKPYLLERLLHF